MCMTGQPAVEATCTKSDGSKSSTEQGELVQSFAELQRISGVAATGVEKSGDARAGEEVAETVVGEGRDVVVAAAYGAEDRLHLGIGSSDPSLVATPTSVLRGIGCRGSLRCAVCSLRWAVVQNVCC